MTEEKSPNPEEKDNAPVEQPLNPEGKEDKVAYESYKKLLDEKKRMAEKLSEFEKQVDENKKKKLEEEGNLKELADQLKAENETLKLENYKQNLIQEAISNNKLKPRLAKMVNGQTEEDIQKSLEDALAFQEEIVKDFKEEHTARDDGGRASKGKQSLMSQEEWMDMYQKDPEKANKYLAELTANTK